MRIDTEFDIGDEVWLIYRGIGTTGKYEVIGPKQIEYIEVQIGNDCDIYENYECEDWCGFFSPDELFKTREAAEITADALNK